MSRENRWSKVGQKIGQRRQQRQRKKVAGSNPTRDNAAYYYYYYYYYYKKLIRRWDSERELFSRRHLQSLLRSAPREATEFGEITQKGPLPHWRSFKVTDSGTNRKLIYDFLLVINANLPPILHRFRDTAFDTFKIAVFGYPSFV